MLPVGAKLLTVHEQHRNVCIWAEVAPEQKAKEARSFEIYGTGHPIPPGLRRFLGSVFLDGGNYVFHIYESNQVQP
jgi:hypothetical protein